MTNKKTETKKFDSLSHALINFRSLIEVVKKDESNPFYKSKYADLPAILEACKDPLTQSGLALFHTMQTVEEQGLMMITTLTHAESGESINSVFPVFGKKPQEIGSSMTYARRYNAQSLLDIPTDDDDGNAANNANKTIKEKTLKDIKPTQKQLDYLKSLAKEKGYSENDIDKVLETIKTAEQASKKIETLKK